VIFIIPLETFFCESFFP